MTPGSDDALNQDPNERQPAAAGTAQVEPDWHPHDWRQCRSFNRDQVEKVKAFVDHVAKAIGGVFVRFCRRPFEVQVISVDQQYASRVTESMAGSAAQDYFLAFGPPADRPMGVLVMAGTTARHWAQWLLGSVESEEASQGLSALEQALLADIAKGVVQAFKGEGSGLGMQPSPDLVQGRAPVNWDPMEELLKVAFRVQGADPADASDALFVMPCAWLAGVAGKTVEAAGKVPGTDISRRVMQCIQDLPVPVAAHLGTVVLTLDDVMGLAVDDVVVLDQSPNEPIDLVIGGQSAFLGLPVRHQGRTAVLITGAVPLSR